VGDYVTYKPERGRLKGHNVTHRLERFETSEEGELMVVTRGIIEGATEDYPVPATAVKTKMVSKLKFTSTLFNVLKTPYGFIFLIVLPLLVMMSLLIYNYMKTSGKQKAERDSEAEKKELAKQKYLEELKKSGISADGAHDKKE
ncbi:MAG TPA: hypothetical protein PK245_05095, partial [Clostridia bacterium]|nr:hypothetical protein [Clostridia bacterium]